MSKIKKKTNKQKEEEQQLLSQKLKIAAEELRKTIKFLFLQPNK